MNVQSIEQIATQIWRFFVPPVINFIILSVLAYWYLGDVL